MGKSSRMSKGMAMKPPKAIKPPGSVSQGYGMKHQLRKGTMYPGMSTDESGLGDPMSDYARMVAAGGH